MQIIGIDPGKRGGIASLRNGKFNWSAAMPLYEDVIDSRTLSRWLVNRDISIAYIEKQQARGNQGGNLTIGTNYGRILAVLDILSIPTVEVEPQVWQGRMLAAELYHCGGDTKKAAIMYCQNRGWEVPRRSGRANSPFNDGISDALCIAAYGAELARVEEMVIA